MNLSLKNIKKTPIRKVIGINTDTLKLYEFLKEKTKESYFFESLHLSKQTDRYFSMGFDPACIISAKGNTLSIKGKAGIKLLCEEEKNEITLSTKNPYEILKTLQLNLNSKMHEGGLIGYFCHEAYNYFQEKVILNEHEDFDTFKLGLYLDGLLYDTTTAELIYYSFHEDRSAYYESALKEYKQFNNTQVPKVTSLGNNTSDEQFKKVVLSTQEKIAKGYSFQSEVGFKSNFKIKGNKFPIYKKLREVNPSPYMYYIVFDKEEHFGASPEVLITCKNKKILTTPTAGTIKRGASLKEDTALGRALLSDEKEIAEHNMLVDLHRNDVASISIPSTVKVEELMYLIKFSHVQHIVSDITGILEENKTAFDVLSSILPGGVVTGAPKLETIKIIHNNEKEPRGIYGGAVGRFSFNGDCNFVLPIRSLFTKGEKAYAQTSAGVVFDSIPENELTEVKHKLAAMQKTLSFFQ